jgi:hypothetical protein
MKLLVALVVTVFAIGGSLPTERLAKAQELNPAPRDAETERLFKEYQGLTRALQPRQVQPAPSPRTDWDARPRGDFWTPSDRQRLFGR